MHKREFYGLSIRWDFNHESWLANQDRLNMTHEGLRGHEGSGEPHEWSGESDECCTSDEQWLYGPKRGQELHQRLKKVNYDGYGWVP